MEERSTDSFFVLQFCISNDDRLRVSTFCDANLTKVDVLPEGRSEFHVSDNQVESLIAGNSVDSKTPPQTVPSENRRQMYSHCRQLKRQGRLHSGHAPTFFILSQP